jgi:hypothetical protein
MRLGLGTLCWVLLGGCAAPPSLDTVAAPPAAVAAVPDPALRLHGHNDYLQPRPLHTALELGLGSVEADVFLVDGELLVGHERWQLRPERTLRSLYLEPLAAWAAGHGGRIRAAAPFVLLVDIKADAAAVYPVLCAQLQPYAALLTRFQTAAVVEGALTVVLSGARPHRELAAERAAGRERLCALDGRLHDLDRLPPIDLMPWLSDTWSRVAEWNGRDDWPAAERDAVAALVARAHAAGRELRFWGTPDRPELWRALFDLGVDRIGTDLPAAAVPSLRTR